MRRRDAVDHVVGIGWLKAIANLGSGRDSR
jgi:hypothetical protein